MISGVKLLHAVFLDAATLYPADLTALSQIDSIRLTVHPYTSADQCLARVQHADIIITNKVQLSAELLRQLPQLKLICVAATGINCVDLQAAQALGITVTNVRDYALDSVPQHAMALLLSLTNQVVYYHTAIQAGAWQQSPIFCLTSAPIRSLAGQTMTIVGYGGLGQATATLAQAFGMHICIAERKGAPQIRPGRTEFYQAIRQADVISLHCPAVAGQSYLFSEQEFHHCKTSALLINTARGQLVDPKALLVALRQGQLAGAALDVLAQEPPPADDPLVNAQLGNLILSPHVAWAASTALVRLVDQLQENLIAFTQGTPVRHCV